MKDFRVIYKMLAAFRIMLNDGGDPHTAINIDTMCTSQHHLGNIFHMLSDAKLLKGTSIASAVITLAGLEYLEDNERMKQIAKEK